MFITSAIQLPNTSTVVHYLCLETEGHVEMIFCGDHQKATDAVDRVIKPQKFL